MTRIMIGCWMLDLDSSLFVQFVFDLLESHPPRSMRDRWQPKSLASWMILLVHLPKVLAVHMRVDLRRRNVGMPEHFLDGAQIGAAFEQMRRERMAKRMRRHHLGDPGAIDVP